ncbi:MAG: hypothetical protein ACOCVM_05515, partial [Desulfovibrionaceae bacterium]
YFGFKRRVGASTVMVAITVALMVVNRDLMRIQYLEPYFKVQDSPVAAQYSPLIMFLAAFLAGFAVIGWLVRVYVKAGKEA